MALANPSGGRRPAPPATTTNQLGIISLADPFAPPKRKKPQPKETLRRQQILKNLGYKIVVDGNWGPRSQKAWNDYVRRQKLGDLQNSPFKREGVKGTTTAKGLQPLSASSLKERLPKNARDVEDVLPVALKKARDDAAARAARKKLLTEQAAQIMRQAQLISRNPQSAATLTLRQLTDVVSSPSVKMKPETEARAVQFWLRSRGYSQVKVTGNWDKDTVAGINAAVRKFQHFEQRNRIRKIKKNIYTGLELSPGDDASWLPGFDGKMPSPKELDAVLQRGGIQAIAVQNAINKFATVDAFNQVKEAQLLALASTHSVAIRLMLSMGIIPEDWQIRDAIQSATDLAPLPDVSGLHPDWQDEAIQAARNNPKWQADNALRVQNMRAAVRIFDSAKSPADAQAKFLALTASQEERWKEIQANMAATDVPWWGDALNSLNIASKFMVHTMAFTRANLPRYGMTDQGLPTISPAPFTSWDEADKILDDMGWAEVLLLEIAFDPLMYTRPFRIASTVLSKASGRATLGSYKMVKLGDGFFDKAWEYQAGAWLKRDVADNAIRNFVVGSALHREALYESLLAEGRKFTALKEHSAVAASIRVSHQAVNAFKRPAHPKAEFPDKIKSLPKRLRTAVDEAFPAVDMELENAPELRILWDSFTNDNVSLYLDAGKTTQSDVAASLGANYVNKQRVTKIHQLATRAADDLRSGFVAENGEGVALIKSQIREINKEYAAYVKKAGYYIKGGVDGFDHSFDQELTDLTLEAFDEFNAVVLPSMQRVLERRAIERSVELFDDAGLWAFRNSEKARTLKALGRKSFDDTEVIDVDNPAFGHGFSKDEMTTRIDQEVRRGIPRLFSYHARQIMAGTLPEGWSPVKAMEELRVTVRNSWEQNVTDGLYYDTRPKIKVSRLYARQTEEAYQGLLRWQDNLDELRDWTSLGTVPDITLPNEVDTIDNALWQLSWMHGGGFARSQIIDHPTRQFHGPVLPVGVTRGEREVAVKDNWERWRRIDGAIARAKVATSSASDYLFAFELARDRSYVAALANAQSNYYKAAYKLLYGSMAVWRFATLPLRPGWVVRNTLDNVAKAFISGAYDPRYYMHGGSGKPGESVFNTNVAKLREASLFLDQLFGTKATEGFDRIVNTFWLHESKVIRKIFAGHGLIPVREEVLDAMKMRLDDSGVLHAGAAGGRRLPHQLRMSPKDFIRADVPTVEIPKKYADEIELRGRVDFLVKENGMTRQAAFEQAREEMKAPAWRRLGNKMAEAPEKMWELMASRPENYMKRVIYRSTYDREMKLMRNSEKYLTMVSRPHDPFADSQVQGPAFHGSQQAFDSFDWEKLAQDTQLRYGKGFYFTENPDVANLFSRVGVDKAKFLGEEAIPPGSTPNVRIHRLNAKNPVHLNTRLGDLPAAQRSALRRAIEQHKGMLEWDEEFVDGEDAAVAEMMKFFDNDENELRQLFSTDADSVFLSDDDYYISVLAFGGFWREVFKSAGFDSMSYLDTFQGIQYKAWVVWDNKQIAPFFADQQGGHFTEAVADELAMEDRAHEMAWETVDKYLFDYSKISVIEDNFKVFFPFIQFWRKNTTFWIGQFTSKPWLTVPMLHFDRARQNSHTDLPVSLRRYLHTEEMVDAAAVIPGLDVVVEAMLPEDAMIDPFSFVSFAPLYRAYRSLVFGDNALLASEEAGVKIIGPMLDAMNDWGLSMNPLVRKPLEAVGIATERNWQSVFPQTQLVEALTQKWFGEEIAGKLPDWEQVFSRLPWNFTSDQIATNFDFYVNQEIAGQVARGEEPSRSKAEATIRAWLYTQTVWGYFAGFYWRRATPEDLYLSKLAMKDFDDMSDEEKSLRTLWSKRGMDSLTYDRYVAMTPLVEAYFRLADDWDAKSQMLKQYPELRRYVTGAYSGHPWSGDWIKTMQRYVDTQKFFTALKMTESTDPPHDVRKAALDVYTSPALKNYWKQNDTSAKVKERQIKAEVFRYSRNLTVQYHSIPEKDFETRNAFIEQHPELIQFWNKNNDPSDNVEAIESAISADLREQYFAIIESFPTEEEGFKAAAPLLKRNPFMFESTTSASKVDTTTGEWRPGAGKWSAAHIADFLEVKPHMTWFFDTFLPKVGKEKAFAWLEASETDAAKMLKAYFKKYPSQKRLDYMRASPWLKIFFGMPPADRESWLKSDSEGARIVRDFFAKYGTKGMTEHAKDYLAAADDLKFYFKMDKTKRGAWLKSGDPRALKVLAYFKKYGRDHMIERFLKKHPGMRNGTPEMARRMSFWEQFYSLPPDQRPLFVLQHAEQYGVFIYGEFGEQIRHDNEMEAMRKAVGQGLNKRQAAYLYVMPLLKFYRTLPPKQKPMFLRANPELQDYFDKYSHQSMTGNKKLDAEVEAYFKLPPNSFARSAFLKNHPKVQDWFDSKSSPSVVAMHHLLEQYFSLTGFERPGFLLDHPEIQAFFDQRKAEKAREAAIGSAFDRADPRLAPFFETAADLERAAARMREKLKQRAYKEMPGIELRRERRTA